MYRREHINFIKNKIFKRRKKDKDLGVVIDPNYFDELFDKISEDIKKAIPLMDLEIVTDKELESLYHIARLEHESVFPIEMNPCNILGDKNEKTWLDDGRFSQIEWNYSERYFEMFKQKVESDVVNDNLKKSTFNVLKRLGDPTSNEPYFVKGLVVGSVQSGKTSNFNGVINASIDAGYRLVIVLAGLMEDLRAQTQDRIDNDVIGYGLIDNRNNTKGKKGVGLIKTFGGMSGNNVEQILSITSTESDFKKSLLQQGNSLNHTQILVCKKNTAVLRNLIVWLSECQEATGEKLNVPLLIIDDEADNASLNNLGARGREYASKINGHIRALLDLFHKKSYLGYTATPFANVLQDQNDAPENNNWSIKYKVKGESKEIQLSQVDNIFPNHFIVLLNPPSNYVGAKQLFLSHGDLDVEGTSEKLPLVETIFDDLANFPSRVDRETEEPVPLYRNRDEFDEKNGWDIFESYQAYKLTTRAARASDNFPKALPKSLEESILCFLLSICVREIRQKTFPSMKTSPHHTMLIHISRFTDWQNTTTKFVKEFFTNIKERIFNDKVGADDSIYKEIGIIWEKYYSTIVGEISDYLPENYVDNYLTKITYDEIQKNLPSAVEGVQVMALNSHRDNKMNSLEYSGNDQVKAIVIGGNRLSRGFTLEGLAINYFIRTTSYADTLLQMGRWFGYRPGYLDCCKIFTKDEIVQNFDATTLTISELESEFVKMEIKGKTPSDFILRVRKHPGVLKITRTSIMRDVKEVKWSYQDKLEQTTTFEITDKKIRDVYDVFKKSVVPNIKNSKSDGKFFKYKTSIDDVIKLLSQSNNYDEITSKTLVKFLEKCKEKGKLSNWTIGVRCSGRAKEIEGKGKLSKVETGLSEDITLSIRSGPKKNNNKTTRFREDLLSKKLFKASGASDNILAGGLDMAISLDERAIINCEAQFREEKIRVYKQQGLSEEEAIAKFERIKNIPERAYREKLPDTEAVLVIYLFDLYYVLLQEKNKKEPDLEFKTFIEQENIDLNLPLIGYAIGIPPISPDPGGNYVIGDYNIAEEVDEDEIEDMDIEDIDAEETEEV